jgi:hypothetical protein
MFFGDRNCHFRAMGVIVDTDVLDVCQIVEVNVKDLSHEGSCLIVEIFVMVVVEGF